MRLDARLTLYAGGTCLATTVGNVLFTDTGLSGPAAMNLSHLVSAHATGGSQPALTVAIDLLAVHGAALEDLLARRHGQALPLRTLLAAVLPAKIPPSPWASVTCRWRCAWIPSRPANWSAC